MPDRSLVAQSGLEGFAVPGRFGRPEGVAGVTLSLRRDLALAIVTAKKGQARNLIERAGKAFGVALAEPGRFVSQGPIAFAGSGPGQWLAMAEARAGVAWEARLRQELSDSAAVSDQSDGRIVVRVAGPAARQTLAKGVPIDLHPRAFGPGQSAVTSVAHIGAHLWQLDDAPTYEFAVFRSFAGAFWTWLAASGAEHGLAVSA